jgi:GNAT superfamily N-acetyltransferase
MNTQVVSYETLNEAQRQQLDTLEILPEQVPFSGDIYCALNTLLVRPSPHVQGVALLADGKPVGFLLLKRGEFLPHWARQGSATLHALQIDHRLQGNGLGKVFLQGLPDIARQTWPDIGQLMLSVDAQNVAALNLYVGQGWVDTGEAYKGRIGYERRLVLDL